MRMNVLEDFGALRHQPHGVEFLNISRFMAARPLVNFTSI